LVITHKYADVKQRLTFLTNRCIMKERRSDVPVVPQDVGVRWVLGR